MVLPVRINENLGLIIYFIEIDHVFKLIFAIFQQSIDFMSHCTSEIYRIRSGSIKLDKAYLSQKNYF